MDERIKTWTLRFPAKENPNMEKALFDWPIVLSYDVKAKYRLISRKFSLRQPKTTRVCIRSINQSNRSSSVRLLFLFCSCVLISRSYQERIKPLYPLLVIRSVFCVLRHTLTGAVADGRVTRVTGTVVAAFCVDTILVTTCSV